MGILTPSVEALVAAHRAPPDALLREMEAHGARDRVPIVQPETGRLLHLLALTARAARVVEIGTAIGVSTLYLARALPPGGRLVSFEIDPERHRLATAYLSRAEVACELDLRLEDAGPGLAALDGRWDLAFVDAAKEQYGAYLDAVMPLLRPGGLVIADNALMGGTVATGEPDADWPAATVAAGRAFLQRFLDHPDLITTVLPVGDGVAVGVRRDTGRSARSGRHAAAEAGHEGGCLCGAVRYTVEGPLRDVLICHCRECQRWSGHALAATAAWRSDLHLTEERGLHWSESPASAAGALRGFCRECGSSLFWKAPGRETVSIAAGTLDGTPGLRVMGHIYVSQAADFDPPADDGTPRHQGAGPPGAAAMPGA